MCIITTVSYLLEITSPLDGSGVLLRLDICEHISETTHLDITKLSVHVACYLLALSFSGGVAMFYIFGFVDDYCFPTRGSIAQNKFATTHQTNRRRVRHCQTRNAWQRLAYSPLGVVVSPPSEY